MGASKLFTVAVAAMGFAAQATNNTNATTTAAAATTTAAGGSTCPEINYFTASGGCDYPRLDIILSGNEPLIQCHLGAYVACLWCQCIEYNTSIVTQMLSSPQGLNLTEDAAMLAGQTIECKTAVGNTGTCTTEFGSMAAVAAVAPQLKNKSLDWALNVTMGQMCAPNAGCCQWGSSGGLSTVTLPGVGAVTCPATGTSTTTTSTTVMESSSAAATTVSMAVLAALVSQF